MEVVIKGDPKEIAALVVALQERRIDFNAAKPDSGGSACNAVNAIC